MTASHLSISFKTLFAHRLASAVCITVAVLNKSLVAWTFSSLKGDKALYLLFADSLLKRGVLADPVSVLENGRHLYLFDPGIISPFYSLAAAPLLWLTGSFFVTQFLLSVISLLLLFTALRQVALLVLRERWMANLFILCTGFFLYPFEQASVVKDVFAAAFCLWGLVWMHRFFQRRLKWTTTALLSLSVACVFLTKFLYAPLGFVLCGIFFFLLVRRNGKEHYRHGAAAFLLLTLVGAAIYLAVLKPASQLSNNSTVKLPSDGTVFANGFFPQNLLLTQPFVSAAVVNTNFWGVQLEQRLGLPYTTVVSGFQLVDVSLLLFLILLAAANLLRMRRQKTLVQLIALSLTMVGAVGYLTITQKALVYKSSPYAWSYASEVRSFFLLMLTLQLLLFLFAFRFRRLRFLRWTLFLLFLFECLHGFYFSLKEFAVNGAKPEAHIHSDGVNQITDYLRQRPPGAQRITIVTSDRGLKRYAQVHYLTAYSFTNLPADLAWMKKGEKFLIATHRSDSALLRKFPAGSLVPSDTLNPFVVHYYEAR